MCSAPQPPPEPFTASARGPFAQSYLDRRLAVWQDRLQLQDWKIEIIQASPEKLRRGTLGNIHWNQDTRSAQIRVLAASSYQMPLRSALQDMEFTLVHELIHLELASLPRSDASRSEEEHAVNHMAEALLALDRKPQ